MPKRFRPNARQIRSTLRRHGFQRTHQKGSHEKWHNPATGKTVIVYEHKGHDLPLGTARAIVEGSGIPEEEFQR
jgi:predicted RNA binding protein YcfA (HicA-like mRNA interferase family)